MIAFLVSFSLGCDSAPALSGVATAVAPLGRNSSGITRNVVETRLPQSTRNARKEATCVGASVAIRRRAQLRNPGMPEQETIERAREDARAGKAPSTQAGEFVREEMEHIREGKHGARSTKQAIAIGLSKARRAGVNLPPPKSGTTSARTRRQAKRDLRKGTSSRRRKPSATRSRAVKKALKREPRSAASHRALSRQAHASARRRSKASRSAAAKKAAATRKRRRH